MHAVCLHLPHPIEHNPSNMADSLSLLLLRGMDAIHHFLRLSVEHSRLF